MNKVTLDKYFDLYPSPYPFDVPERISNGLRRPYDINDEKHLIFPEKNSKKKSIENVLIVGSGYSEGVTMGAQVWIQIVGVLATLIWCGVVSFVILKVVDRLIGLRSSEEDETQGLDIAEHNERGYII